VTFDMVAAGGRYGTAAWADHRSSKFGPWPVVSGTGAPEASRARVLTSGNVKLNLDGAVRARVAVITGLAVLGYVVTVYLIFFLTYTPLNIDHVRGAGCPRFC
jgi:hypothetical protein